VRSEYQYLIDVSDDSAPARVVRMVGTGKRVLEIGAGPGSITRALRNIYDCRITAIEFNDEWIEDLKPLCERVYRLDLNDPSWPAALESDAKFDVVVAADVVEHLYDPWSALPRMKQFIGPGGYLVCSIPHAGHNAIIASLLDENFEYGKHGLLDKTHIRFFGLQNIQNLFDQAGLAITEAQFVMRFPESTALAGAWERIPTTTRVALLKNKYGFVYQVVIKAEPISDGVRGVSLLDLSVEGFADVARPASTHRVEIQCEPESVPALSESSNGRLVAFFLTQFHPTPENDRWWGKGFTEWTSVTKAEPLFDGHYQPHLPADLGFYDLRLREARHAQIALARQYGIDAFCYYYYWFSGTRVLHQPLDDMLHDPQSDMPFCLCWANENWTRRWDGADREILIAQKYLANDDIDFIRGLIPFFQDPRYIRLNGAPFLIVYQPQRLPDPRKTGQLWREYCEKIGVGPIHLCAALTNDNEDYAQFGFDSGLQFPPHNCNCENINDQIDFYTPFHGRVVEYQAFAQSYIDKAYPHSNVFRSVTPSWDQTPRVGSRAFLALNGTPANYEYWLSQALRKTRQEFPGEERFVFINAWNEWAEGCHLEPDRRFQRQFLEATLAAKSGESERTSFEDVGSPRLTGSGTSWHAKLDQLRQELSSQRERAVKLEQELATERQRLSDVYRDLLLREEIAALKRRLRQPEGSNG
jgi:2-polyprenyl-3-methyl-5-hydroxy-6-metoxy-1,4-benzoquinol methylase